jgi:structure-specific endonuclease subunit SLX1
MVSEEVEDAVDTDCDIKTATATSINDGQHFFVYLLESSLKGATYVGATVDVGRRLRQHNKEITGGAVATGTRVQRGETWHLCCHVRNFPTWKAALQFEWRWKQIARRCAGSPLQRRAAALRSLLDLERPTSKSVPYAEWPREPEIIFARDEFRIIMEQQKI